MLTVAYFLSSMQWVSSKPKFDCHFPDPDQLGRTLFDPALSTITEERERPLQKKEQASKTPPRNQNGDFSPQSFVVLSGGSPFLSISFFVVDPLSQCGGYVPDFFGAPSPLFQNWFRGGCCFELKGIESHHHSRQRREKRPPPTERERRVENAASATRRARRGATTTTEEKEADRISHHHKKEGERRKTTSERGNG